jgi:hypothetical protein
MASSQIEVEHLRESMRLIEARLEELKGSATDEESQQLEHDYAWQAMQVKLATRH